MGLKRGAELIRKNEGVDFTKNREGLKISDVAFLSNDGKFTSFEYNNKIIRFKTSSKLEKYTNVLEWDNGYLVVTAVYNGVETEDYIDLIPILENLCIDSVDFLKNIRKVKICYD